MCWKVPFYQYFIKGIEFEYGELYNRYNGNIPDDINADFYADVDRYLTSELDANLMNEINDLFEKKGR